MPKSIKLLNVVIFCVCVLCTSALFAVPKPSGVQGYSGTEVHFEWGKSSGVVRGYRIYWGEAKGGPYLNRLCDVVGTEQQHIAKLNREQTHHLVCRAYNEYGESDNSNEVIWPD
jgi:hypothetical protein